MRDLVDGLPDADALVREERQRAVRLLLRHPFVTDEKPDPMAFSLVRRHEAELRRWFREQLGYRLVVDHEQARLFKRRPPGNLSRPVATRTDKSFDRRRYSLLCLILAALERLEVQTILSALAEEVKDLAAAADAPLGDGRRGVAPFEPESFSERQCFVDAVRYLVDLGVLKEADGDDTAFVRGQGDVLYDVDARRLARMLASPVPPSLAAGPESLNDEVYPPTEEGRNLRIRHRLMRRLVEDPVLYFDDLGEDERAYVTWQRAYLIRQVEEWTGLAVEVRREGMAAIDVEGRLSDVTFPSTSNVAHAALLFADELAGRLRDSESSEEVSRQDAPPRTVPRGELVETAWQVFRRHHWAKVYREDPAGAERLLDDALAYLSSLGLVRERPEGVEPLAAIARYRVAADEAGS